MTATEAQRVTRAQIEGTILSLIRNPDADTRLGTGEAGLHELLADHFPDGRRPDDQTIMAAVWSLVGRGLAYLDYSDPIPENWLLKPVGAKPAPGSAESPEAFLEWLNAEVPVASPTVFHYASEALVAYNAGCALASAVCVGLSTEAAFHELADAFARALPDGQRQIYDQALRNPRTRMLTKFNEFTKRLEHFHEDLPAELRDDLGPVLGGIEQLMTVYRNAAGHPKPMNLGRDAAFINLELFARSLRYLYQLKAHFETAELPDRAFASGT